METGAESAEEHFRDFVTSRWQAMLRTAYLLTGDHGRAEDLLQTALVRTHRRWNRIDDPELYTRRVLANLNISWWRRRRITEHLTGTVPETAVQDPHTGYETRDALWTAMLTLPPRMRAVLVLRYFEDLPEAEVARTLGCSLGTVKSQASRGLERLRGHPGITGDPGARVLYAGDRAGHRVIVAVSPRNPAMGGTVILYGTAGTPVEALRADPQPPNMTGRDGIAWISADPDHTLIVLGPPRTTAVKISPSVTYRSDGTPTRRTRTLRTDDGLILTPVPDAAPGHVAIKIRLGERFGEPVSLGWPTSQHEDPAFRPNLTRAAAAAEGHVDREQAQGLLWGLGALATATGLALFSPPGLSRERLRACDYRVLGAGGKILHRGGLDIGDLHTAVLGGSDW
ncbi:SigE family RNA polymerase sigma factor [Streptosporangium sp. NPDC000239]|uniref:SigE family RNA polymerase sigma factor n=1 Tax=Streptosporangium sp. NPDC000239 TaxID=3154248 RepID=UPI00331CB787